MTRIPKYIHQQTNWPNFTWRQDEILELLAEVRYAQGRLAGRMETLGFDLQDEASLQTLTLDVTKSSEIEGEILDATKVRSSIAKRLGIEIVGISPNDRNLDAIVEMILDATQNYIDPLSAERLYGWQAALFPTGRSSFNKITVGAFRNNSAPMQVVSGPIGREKVHYEAPDSELIEHEMITFLHWFNTNNDLDAVIKAALAHFWFITIHPFDDGNGRIARAITDLLLARADSSKKRFYSMSAQIVKDREAYYNQLEESQKEGLDITAWLIWFLNCLQRSLVATDEILAAVLRKAVFWQKLAAQNFNERQILMLNKLLDGFHGKLSSEKWAKIGKCSRETAIRDINDLVERQILMKGLEGGRSTSYLLRYNIEPA